MNKLLLSYINTSFGFWLISFLVPLIVLDITGSSLAVSISYALNIVPYIILTPFSGVLSDILNRKKMIIAGEFLCCITAIILFFVTHDKVNVSIIITLGFVISSLSAIHHPVFQSIIPDLFHKNNIKNINANVGIIDSIVSIIAPAALGALLFQFDKKMMIIIVAFCYFISFMIMLTIPYTKKPTTEKISFSSVFRLLGDGFLYIYRKHQLRNIAFLFFFVNIGIRVIYPNLMWVYGTVFHLTPEQIASLFILMGIGSIIGAKIGGIIIGKYSDVNIIMFSSFVIGLCSLLLILPKTAVIHAIIWSASSMAQSVIVVTFFTYRQKVTESYILGRVVSVTRLIAFLAIPLASVSSGWMLKSYSVNYIYLASFAVILFSLIAFAMVTRRDACTE